ncbi:MAG: hypothetical protein K5668_03285 [Lachnospiraceae bacterium]|nr:hypothetical protein [Lachnospiraceae bacterium]
MVTDLQANVLSANTVKKAVPSCLVYALVQSMTFMVDTIVAGHFLGTDAVAAIALGMPMIGLMLSFTGMILQGAFLKLLNAMGRNDMEDYDRIFSLALIFTIIVDCIFLALCLFQTDAVLGMGGAGKAELAAVTLGRLYVRTACLEILFFALGSLFQLVIATYGYQADRMICSVVCVIVNVITSVVLVMNLPAEISIAGLGIGSAMGTLAQLLMTCVMMKRRSISVKFRFCAVNRKNAVDSLDMLRRGFPSSVDNMLDSISGSVVNNIILASFAEGTAVLALVSIIKTIYNLVRTVGRGVFYSSEPLIGILNGGRDNEGIKKTFITALKLGTAYAAVLALIFIVIKTPLLSFYNIADNADANTGLILIAISGIVVVFPFAFNAVYESTGHLLLSLSVAVIPDSILYPLLIPFMGKAFGITGIWIAMGFSFIPFFILFYLIFALITGSFPVPLDRLLRLKVEKDRITELDVSVPVDAKDVTFVSEKLQRFMLENGVDRKAANKASLCTEEIAADYIEHRKSAKQNDKKAYMDIKVFRTGDMIQIILRNYDEPYNPLVFEQDKEGFSKIGVVMVQKISREISYSYAYHLNVVSIVMES